MSQSLKRILRLREQSEEICRLELKREVMKLRAVEHALDASKQESRSSRSDAFLALSNSAPDEWLLAESSHEIAEWQIRNLKPGVERQKLRVEELREQFLECRKEKRQVEQLIEAETRAATAEESRRQQTALDDWYGRAKRRKALHPRERDGSPAVFAARKDV